MDRIIASQFTRTELNKHNLSDWKVRLTSNPNQSFLGLCSYQDKCIFLNAHHIDIHSNLDVINTIRHEVAHALTQGHGHDSVWRDKAIEIGCDNTNACSHLSLPEHIIDAIRSGHIVEYEVKEEVVTNVIRTPTYKVTRLQDKCPECGKVAKEKFSIETVDKNGDAIKLITLECFHIIKKVLPRATPFESMVSNDWKPEIKQCKHEWTKNKCNHCGEFKLYSFQVTGAKATEIGLASQRGFGIFDDMGLGKALSLKALIATPFGFRSMESLNLGDLVISSDGKSYPITGIYPQGKLDTYRILFSDFTKAICSEEHLWIVNTPTRKYRNQPNLVKSVKELKGDLYQTSENSSGKQNNKWYIPITKPVEFAPVTIPIDPYTLGLLLGDGYFGETHVTFTKSDNELHEYLSWKRNGDTSSAPKEIKNELNGLGLIGTRANNKFVPEDYKFNSIDVRWSVLRGLMDTDGSVWNNEVVEYTTISSKLANDVIFLVQSLGGICRLTIKEEPKYTYKNEILIGQKCYRIVVNIPECPFSLKRKALSWTNISKQKKYKPTRAIFSIEKIGQEECQCISVDSPDKSYLIEDFVVTHNTVQALAILKYHNEYTPTMVVTKSAIKFQWFKQAVRWLGPEYISQIISTSRDYLMPGLKLYIIPYDLLRRFPREKLHKLRIKCVILDEVQQIKNPDSARTQEVRKLVGASENCKVIELSGTPWKNRGGEFFPALNLLDPVKFHSHQGYLDRWVDYYWHGNKRKMGGIRNVEKFKEYTNGMLIRREYNEVMDEFPEVNRMKLSIQLSELEQSAYDDSVSEFVAWYNQAIIDGVEEQLNGIELLARMARLRHITGLAKIPATLSFVEEFIEDYPDKKLVIFVHHKDVGVITFDCLNECDKTKNPDWFDLANELKESGTRVLKLNAEMDDSSRFTAQESFNNSPRAILIASTLACGEGLDLQTCADSIMHERQWNPQNEDQAAPGRFRRIGQVSSVINITFPEAEGTIDQHLDIIVEEKRRNFHEVMNKGEVKGWSQDELAHKLAEMIVNKHREKRSKKEKRA